MDFEQEETMSLYTIGYEKREIEEFLEILQKKKIRTVVDIRAVPYSRRHEYSKKDLAAALEKRGIEYILISELGTPRELRDQVKADQDYESFFAKYRKYLRGQAEPLNRLLEIARKKTSCLLCYERDVNHCHRRVTSEKIEKLSKSKIAVRHL